ncbi:unnamed protein product, partial [Phaeothamnion confervicola]
CCALWTTLRRRAARMPSPATPTNSASCSTDVLPQSSGLPHRPPHRQHPTGPHLDQPGIYGHCLRLALCHRRRGGLAHALPVQARYLRDGGR